jgi:hypothetical protein
MRWSSSHSLLGNLAEDRRILKTWDRKARGDGIVWLTSGVTNRKIPFHARNFLTNRGSKVRELKPGSSAGTVTGVWDEGEKKTLSHHSGARGAGREGRTQLTFTVFTASYTKRYASGILWSLVTCFGN